MTELVQNLFRSSKAASETKDDLKIVVIFCGTGLLVSLFLAAYALDLGPGFF
jgi:hypothetical protein